MYELWTAQGSGGAVIEAALALADAPARLIDAPPWEDGPHLEALHRLNPLGQVPALVLADGTVITESGAIALLLAERHPEAGLAPAAGDPLRPTFLRWLFFINAGIYALFRFEDRPERLVSSAQSQAEARDRLAETRKAMLRQLDAAAGAPWFLGKQRTLLDLYIAVMRHWRPRRTWFDAHCPALAALARRVESDPRLAPVFDRHFGDQSAP
ncbi:glutathione S-transferase family protein [Pedomonas sp. V897]|uniref:glutathione S-transferase family protein n=1 Tax=Pedomonas sp. V897 TaxID=3446482 RepID=UPI003EDF32C7